MMVLLIGSLITVIALPNIDTTMRSFYLGSAASSLAAEMESARFQAVSYGCQIQVSVSPQTYQISAMTYTGTPPSCSGTYQYWCAGKTTTTACAIPYAYNQVSCTNCTTAQVLQFNPNGTVTAAGTPPLAPQTFNLTLGQTVGSATKTVIVSGAGYVKVQ
jgi:Tfp pilus assembly protein FimT